MSRFTIDLSPEINDRLTEIAKEQGITKAEAMRKAFALLSISEKEKKEGNTLGIIHEGDGKPVIVGRLVGL